LACIKFSRRSCKQSLLILQTPLLNYATSCSRKMETNPVLEELPDQPGADERGEAEPSADDNFDNEFQKLASLDEEWRDYMAQSASYSSDGARGQRKRRINASSFSIPFQTGTLQAKFGRATESERAQYQRSQCCGADHCNIDDNGFLQSTPEEMALNSEFRRKDSKKCLR